MRSGDAPSLSVVLLSVGHVGALERAIAAVLCVTWRTTPEVIVVRAGADGRTRERIGGLVARAKGMTRYLDAESSRASMIDEGMRAANGDIVLVRDDESCADLEWVRPFAMRLDDTLEVWIEGAPERRSVSAAPRREERIVVGEARL